MSKKAVIGGRPRDQVHSKRRPPEASEQVLEDDHGQLGMPARPLVDSALGRAGRGASFGSRLIMSGSCFLSAPFAIAVDISSRNRERRSRADASSPNGVRSLSPPSFDLLALNSHSLSMSAVDVALPQRVPYHTRAPAAMRRPQPKKESREEAMDADDEFPDAQDSDFIKVSA